MIPLRIQCLDHKVCELGRIMTGRLRFGALSRLMLVITAAGTGLKVFNDSLAVRGYRPWFLEQMHLAAKAKGAAMAIDIGEVVPGSKLHPFWEFPQPSAGRPSEVDPTALADDVVCDL